MFKLYDVIRVDHFRGLVAYWETPAGEKTALNGSWQPAPFYDFMNTVLKYLPALSLIAEDLGVITPDVREAMRRYDMPGIKVLLFAYAKEMHERMFLPHNHIPNSVVYTSTHDTNTCTGWFQKNDIPEDKERFFKYIGRSMDHDVHWEFIKLAMMSVAHTTIIPLQDLLGLGEAARMNTPGVPDNNWLWRYQADQVTPAIQEKLREMTDLYERS